MLWNADVGEIPQDRLLIPFLDIANIACSFHAGNADTMQETVLLAKKNSVKISAHVSYKDKKNFGRKSIFSSKKNLKKCLLQQLEKIEAICEKNHCLLEYMKPHGALYNDALSNTLVWETLAETLQQFNPKLKWIFFSSHKNKEYENMANNYGLKLIFEVFPDRNYKNGFLLSRKEKNAVIQDAKEISLRILSLQKKRELLDIEGKKMQFLAQTFCLHGDNPAALEAIKIIKKCQK